MKRNLTWIGIIIMLIFSLTMFAGCADKKAIVKEGSGQEVSADQSAQDAKAVAEAEAYRKQQEKETALPTPSKEQETKVQAATPAKAQASKDDPFIKDINFDFDKSNIRPDAREILKANADYFLKSNATSVLVQGHCDERGTAEYNMALGERRAREAKKYLVNLGIQDSIITTISFGKWKPLDPGSNEDAWAKNRRAHFLMSKPK